MVRITGLALAGALLTAVALVSISSAQESLEVTLDSLEGFDITGSATLTRTKADYTDVLMIGSGLDPRGETHINHIHEGTGCGNGEYGAVVVTLPSLADTDSDGVMLGRTTVTTTDTGDRISFEAIADGNHVLIIHEVDGTPAACGAIPALVAEEADADASPEKAPAVGSGGFDRDGGAGQSMLLAAVLAALGIGGVGAALIVRHARR